MNIPKAIAIVIYPFAVVFIAIYMWVRHPIICYRELIKDLGGKA